MQVQELKAVMPGAQTRSVTAIASGKGGVGKTWLAITLAHALAEQGRRVLLFDGDLGLANVDIQLGLAPNVDLSAVLAGRATLADARLTFAKGKFDIVAGRSGTPGLAGLGSGPLTRLSDALTEITADCNDVLLDLGAGVERNVKSLAGSASRVIVVVTDEPTSLTDAYAFIKLTAAAYPDLDFRVVVNLAASRSAGERTYETLATACEKFLDLTPQLLGIVRSDAKVKDAIRHQAPLLTRHPGCQAARDVRSIAKVLIEAGDTTIGRAKP